MTIKTEQLHSTAITSATYDDETLQLSLVFASGQSYDFPDVPQEIFDGLVNAPSAGQYYHQYIKGTYG